jgi:hypothetical protein
LKAEKLAMIFTRLFEAAPEVWDLAFGSERVLVFIDDPSRQSSTGIKIDVSKKSIHYPATLREGRSNCIFIFQGMGIEKLLSGTSPAVLKEEGLLTCQGDPMEIFKSSYFLDHIAMHLGSDHTPAMMH